MSSVKASSFLAFEDHILPISQLAQIERREQGVRVHTVRGTFFDAPEATFEDMVDIVAFITGAAK